MINPVVWMVSVFRPKHKPVANAIYKQTPCIRARVSCCECKNVISQARLNKILYTYNCRHGHEYSVEHYNYHALSLMECAVITILATGKTLFGANQPPNQPKK